MLSEAGHPRGNKTSKTHEAGRREGRLAGWQAGRQPGGQASESNRAGSRAGRAFLMNAPVYIYRLQRADEQPLRRRRIPPVSNNFIFAFNTRRPQLWDRTGRMPDGARPLPSSFSSSSVGLSLLFPDTR